MSSDETFGTYLKRRFYDWTGKALSKNGRIPSQADFAKWLGVPTTSLSVWMNDVRKPTGESVDKIADKLGIEVYDKLGMPRRMPRNKTLYALTALWDKLSQEDQDKLLEIAKEHAGDPTGDLRGKRDLA